MKSFSRFGLLVAVLALAACGTESEVAPTGEQQDSMKMYIPVVQLRLPEFYSQRGDEEPGGEGIDEVRETGFEPGGEDEEPGDEGIDEVRETGFVPAPVLEVLELRPDRARLSWTADESVTRFRLSGLAFDSDGRPHHSIEIVVDGYDTYDLPLDGRRTIVSVVALDDGGKAISKQSNAVDLPAR